MKFLPLLLLLCLTCEAQVSPRRRLLLGSPNSLSVTGDMVLWLKADNVTNVLDNSEVRMWPDSSTNNKPATTSGTPATWMQNQQNGKPGVDFNGTTMFLQGTVPTISATCSVFTVHRFDVTNANQFTIKLGTSQGFSHQVLATGLRSVQHRAVANCDDAPASLLVEQWTSVRTPTPLESMWVARTNVTISNSGSACSAPNVSYFVASFDGAIGFMNGMIFEIIVYERSLSTTERQSVENYLAVKYGLP